MTFGRKRENYNIYLIIQFEVFLLLPAQRQAKHEARTLFDSGFRRLHTIYYSSSSSREEGLEAAETSSSSSSSSSSSIADNNYLAGPNCQMCRPALLCFSGKKTGKRREDRSCLLYTSPSPRDRQKSRMPSSA